MSAAFIRAAQIKQTVTYLDLVAAAVLGYDYCLTFRREVKYVWTSHLSLGKVLFFLTRYPVFGETALVLYHQFAVMGPEKCDIIYKTIGYQLGTGTFIAESILAMRTWVLWHRNPYIGVALICGLVLFWTPVFYFLQESLNSLVFTTAPEPDTPGCFLLTQKNILFAVFVLITSFETLILTLTLIRFIPLVHHKKTSLIKVIYRDGIMNYFYLCILSICNVVVLLTAPRGYSTLLSALQRVMHSVLSARVLLHLREAVSKPTTFGTQEITGLETYSVPNTRLRFEAASSFFMGPEDGAYPMRDLRVSRSERRHPQLSEDEDDWEAT
ncbi:unnamed protein product [Somion occarium]|uniref:DUF6533 domain-containing protein n=1 Tax=Somion occarium TaxID=3059160 RepID=A0ABP1E837_9APHY